MLLVRRILIVCRRLLFRRLLHLQTFKRNVVQISVCVIHCDKWLIVLAVCVVCPTKFFLDNQIKFVCCFVNVASSNSALSSITNDEQAIEQEAASKHLDTMKTDDARADIKVQVKTFSSHFHKKCMNKNVHIDALIQDYGIFKDALKKRIHTHPIYQRKWKYYELFFC